MSIMKLSRLDFQLAYLVLLTRAGLKPLSRWEKPLPGRAHDLIRAQNLLVDTVDRRTGNGGRVVETIFARSPRHTAFYRNRFQSTDLKQTRANVRLEGRLFGYPSCCVETFIRKPYTPNRLDPDDQRILFHWACPDCRTTPALLREYRRVYAECCREFSRTGDSRDDRSAAARFTGALARAAASIALLAGASGLAQAQDPHWLPVENDVDTDYLSFAEEVLRGTDWWNADTDQNGTLDGVQTAQRISELIAAPPPGVIIEDHEAWGLEICAACGEVVNMGFVRVIHLERGISTDVPYIGLHYLAHGSLGYLGDVHDGRVDLDALKRILMPCDPAHLLPAPGSDPDEDGLLSEEEPLLGTDPEIPDSDGDSLIDGPQTAEELLPLIGALPSGEVPDEPYMLEHQADGLENCEVCGVVFNMGLAEIVNPLEEFSVGIPFVGLHTLGHGGFTFEGSYNEGRIMPTVLKTVLTGQGTAHWIPVDGDGDGDGLTDQEEEDLNLNPEDPDENDDGIPDGRQIAEYMADEIEQLPVGPLPDETYVIHHPAFGYYNCLTCGEEINMGLVEIVDPVEGQSVNVPYYNLHFMKHGSFSTDRDDIYPRVDPRAIAAVLDLTVSDVDPAPGKTDFAFHTVPNPFAQGGRTQIMLALPAAPERLEVGVYDAGGRKVRELFSGKPQRSVLHFQWDGRDDAGQDLAAGVYYAKAVMGRVTISRKLTLLK
ncbi:MAG: hypothetical protein GF355_02800 [Candidatus Eisenbacteria bacterium]|nr:hypothetical protein [Candidatus Eisenbacteria bacterium]